jgi:hypothetical protein
MEKIKGVTSNSKCWGIIFCLLLFVIPGCQAKQSAKQGITHLLPTPQKITRQKGISLNPQKIKTIYLYAQAGKADQFAASLLQDKIDSLFGSKVDVRKVHSYKNIPRPAAVLGIPSTDRDFSNFCSGLKLPSPKKNMKQSYVLNIGKNLITISGEGKAGLFYGVQTLNQLLEDAQWNDTPLQGMLIQDWPDIKWRAIQIDDELHLDRYWYYKDAIAKLARYKVNAIVFEFADKFDYKLHPIITAPHSLSPEQVKNLTEYAHKYHITIIPLVEGLGHVGYILKHPKFKTLRANPNDFWTFNPLKKGTYKLLFSLYNETMKATPGINYFHIGGDEAGFTGKNHKMQAYRKKHGPFSLYLHWLKKANGYVNKHGRTTILWDDMPLKIAGLWLLTYPRHVPEQKFDSLWDIGVEKLDSVIKKFPQNAVYSHWSYGMPNKGDALILDWFKKHGLKEMSATAAQSYSLNMANIKSFITLSACKHVWGELCTAWDDNDPNFETFWMGFLASANYAWNYKSPSSIRQYWNKYFYRFWGPNTHDLYNVFHNFDKSRNFWNTAIMKEGTKRSYREKKKDQQLIHLPSLQNVPPEGSWSKHFQKLMTKAKVEKKMDAQDIKVLKNNMNVVKRNTYNLKVYATFARFMELDTKLILSIGRIASYCDKCRTAQKENEPKKIVVDLNRMADIADSAWDNYKASYDHLKKVWQVIRYPKGGKRYIPYRNSHFASRRSNLSFLIMAEEGLDLPGYAKRLRQLAEQYKKEVSSD